MKTLAIVSQKGGVGKTTIAVHLAVAAAKNGYSVAIIDLDPQATAAQWSDWRAEADPNPVVTGPPAGTAENPVETLGWRATGNR